MPIYTYECDSCGHQFDQSQSINDERLKTCPKCKKDTLQKIIQNVGISFKGSGFYINDSKKQTSTSS